MDSSFFRIEYLVLYSYILFPPNMIEIITLNYLILNTNLLKTGNYLVDR